MTQHKLTDNLDEKRIGTPSRRVYYALHTEQTHRKSKAAFIRLNENRVLENWGKSNRRQPLFLPAPTPTVSGMNPQPQPVSHAAV